jgi:hypothetical protein
MELLPPAAELHTFQVQVCNLVLMRSQMMWIANDVPDWDFSTAVETA